MEVPPEAIGKFYAGDSYVVHYTMNGGTAHVVYVSPHCDTLVSLPRLAPSSRSLVSLPRLAPHYTPACISGGLVPLPPPLPSLIGDD